MTFNCVKRVLFHALFCCLVLGLSLQIAGAAFACDISHRAPSHLKERIEFDVKWWFVPLVETYMETHQLPNGKDPTLYRLTHQAAVNTFWNDRMESIVDSKSLLPCQMDTLIKDGDGHRKDSIIFERPQGKARLLREDRENGETIVSNVAIGPQSMDPLSAFYYLRKRLSPSRPQLELKGITGSRHFSLQGRLVAEEAVEVPAGTFKTYRLECSLKYWLQSEGNGRMRTNRRNNAFTLWLSQDEHRFPVQIRYRLSLGNLWVRATSVQTYDLVS